MDIQKTPEDKHRIVVARGICEARDAMMRIGHFGILAPKRLRSALQSMDEILDDLGMRKRRAPAVVHA
jgi:aspartate aminotransferase-like enzyme